MKISLRCLTALMLGLALVSGLTGCSRRQKEARYLKRADKYYDAKDYEKAEIEYINALRLSGTNNHAVARLANIYYSRGDIRKAAPVLMLAARQQPNNFDLREKLATIYLQARYYGKAREEAMSILTNRLEDGAIQILADASVTPAEAKDTLQRLLRLPQQVLNRAAVQVALGTCYFRLQDLNSAELAFKQARVLDSRSTAAIIGLGNVLWARGKVAEANTAFQTAAEQAPLKSAERLKWIDFKIKTGDKTGARQILEQTLEKEPEFQAALLTLANLAFEEQKYDEALQRTQKILDQNSTHPEALTLRGRIKVAKGEEGEGIEELERLTKINPKNPKAHYQLGMAHMKNRESAKAETSIAQALVLNPNYAEALLARGQIEMGKADFSRAIQTLGQFLKIRPQHELAQLLLAQAHRARGSGREAITIYTNLLSLSPTNASLPFMIGSTYMEMRNLAEARKAFQVVIERVPDSFPAIQRIIEIDIAEKKFAQALKRAEELSLKYPKSPEPHFLAALIYSAQNNFGKAEAALQRVLEIDPKHQAAYLQLAKTYVASNKFDEAREKLEASLVKKPDDPLILFILAMLYEKKGDLDKSVKSYEKIIELQPDSSAARNNLAALLLGRPDQADKAHELAKRAREISPQDPHIADTLGWALYQKGDYAGALPLLQESADKLANNPEVLFHLGATLYAQGREEAAVTTLERALGSPGDFAFRNETRQMLEVLQLNELQAGPAQLESLKKIISTRPNDVVAMLRAGAISERLGATAQAQSYYEQAREKNPRLGAVLVRLARLYAGPLKDPAKALELAKDARQLAPDDQKTAAIAGEVAYQAGDYKWALGLLQEGERKDPKRLDILFYLSMAQVRLGRINDAEATLQRLQQSSGGATDAKAKRLTQLLALYRSPDKLSANETLVGEALQAEPTFPLALLLSGMLREQRGQFGEAAQTYEQILAANEAFTPAAKRSAILFAEKLKDDKKAFERAAKAKEVMADDPDLARVLGKLLYRRNDFAGATRYLREAIRSGKADAETYFNLGMAHYHSKEKGPSKDALNKALELNPTGPFVESAKQILAELK